MKRSRLPLKGGVDLAAMVDVIFLLLAYFLINATLARHAGAVDVELPPADSGSIASTAPAPLDLTVHADGVITLRSGDGEAQPIEPERLPALLRRELGDDGERPVRLYGDAAADYRFIVAALDAVREAQVSSFQLMTTSKDH